MADDFERAILISFDESGSVDPVVKVGNLFPRGDPVKAPVGLRAVTAFVGLGARELVLQRREV